MRSYYWLSALVVFGSAYLFYIPLPAENTGDLVMVHALELGMRLAYFYPMNALKYIGVDWQVWWARKSLRALAQLLSHAKLMMPDDGAGEIQVSNANFDGVPVIVYEPRLRRSDGAIVFIHGGGFVLLDAETYDLMMRHLANAVGVTVFNIDYRTAPEHLFPTALNDCDKATSYLLTTAYREYSIDPNRVAIVGDSAGGNLAAGSAFRSLDRPGQLAKPKLQVLLYPLLQFIDFRTPSYSEAAKLYGGSSLANPEFIVRLFSLYVGLEDGVGGESDEIILRNGHLTRDSITNLAPFVLEDLRYDELPFNKNKNQSSPFTTTAIAKQQRRNYDEKTTNTTTTTTTTTTTKLGAEIQAKLRNYLFDQDLSPMMRKDLSASPKTLLITCQYDPLRDEGFWYAKRLRKAGVNVTWLHYENAFHGIINFHPVLQLAERMLNDVVHFIGNNL